MSDFDVADEYVSDEPPGLDEWLDEMRRTDLRERARELGPLRYEPFRLAELDLAEYRAWCVRDLWDRAPKERWFDDLAIVHEDEDYCRQWAASRNAEISALLAMPTKDAGGVSP